MTSVRKALVAALPALFLSVSSFAAETQIYGVIDLALGYAKTDNGTTTQDTFQMKSGPTTQSRFGFKGSEQIGNITAGFVLENGFDVDTGALGNKNRLFGREAQVFLKGDLGTIKIGRMGALMSGLGSTGIFGGTVTAFPTGRSTAVPNHKSVMGGVFTQHDNTVTYTSPDLAGMQAHLQYSSSRDTKTKDGRENTGDVDRYLGAGLVVKKGAFKGVVMYDRLNYASSTAGHPSDAYTISFGGNYDFGSAKVFLAAQRFAHAKPTIALYNTNTAKTGINYAKGYGTMVSTAIPMGAHTLKFGLGYMTAESDQNSKNEVKRYIGIAGYGYRFSKRTSFYVNAGYDEEEYSKAGAENASVFAVESGIVTRF